MKNNHLHFGNNIDISKTNIVYFSMGCFWRSESLFWNKKGIVYTEVGYAECVIEEPSCNDAFKDVEHKEVVKVYYNDDISFEDLLNIFFNNHTSDKRDDFPVPSLYKSRVYVEDESFFKPYENYIKEFIEKRKEKGNNHPIMTEIKLIKNYKKADEHHQQYILKN